MQKTSKLQLTLSKSCAYSSITLCFAYIYYLSSFLFNYIGYHFHSFRVPLKEALESKRPLTRTVLESRISEVQALLDDAVSRKAFTECAPLQEKMEKLVQKRAGLPTLDELKEAVRLAEKDVADAAARRDFTGAASAQAALDKANERLEDA